MKRNLANCTAALAISSALAGCANPEIQEQITLEKALTDTVDAMYAAHQESIRKADELHYKNGLGISACQVTAKFLIDAKHTTENKLALTAGPAPATVIPVPLSASASSDTTATGERSNTVTVLYASKACSPKAGSGTGS